MTSTHRLSFSQDFKRFFLRGLAALLPTIITLWMFTGVWSFLYDNLGRHLIWLIKRTQWAFADQRTQAGQIDRMWDVAMAAWVRELIGVSLAVLVIYVVGLFVGNLIGRTFWKIGETLVMKVPVIRAIYPAVKQITDFLLEEKKAFAGSRVVAVQPHEQGIWSIGLVTGDGPTAVSEASGEPTVNVFLPNSPAAFSGYVLVVPKSKCVELPIKVEEVMRLFVSGGVLSAEAEQYVKQMKAAPGSGGVLSEPRVAVPAGSK